MEHFNLHALLGAGYTFFDFDLVLKLLFENKQIHILFHEIFTLKDPLSYDFDTQSSSLINYYKKSMNTVLRTVTVRQFFVDLNCYERHFLYFHYT